MWELLPIMSKFLHLRIINANQASSNLPPIMDAEMRGIFSQMAQSMTTKAQAATVQAQAMTAQANRGVVPRPHQQVTTMASRLRNFTRMNPPTFYGSMVDEDPQQFLNEVYKVLYSMGVTSSEKAVLSSYQLKNVAQTWYIHWRDNRLLSGGPVSWEIFKVAFLNRFFPREMREEKVTEFINLRQVGRSVNEYSLEFFKLSKYAPSLVFDPK